MKNTFNKTVAKLLRCPVDRHHSLVRKVGSFYCVKCNVYYQSKYIKGIEIPDFLIKKENWKRGFRGLSSKFISIFQTNSSVKRRLPKSRFVLDIGCGENARGNINVDCYIPRQIPSNFILANAEHLPFKNNCVDYVYCYYVIEHLINPALFVSNVYAISKQRVEIITDNSEWFGDVIFRIIGSGRIFHDEHTYKWSIEYISNLIRRLGIKRFKAFALNLSTTPFVKIVSILGNIPRIGNFFYRDLKIIISKQSRV
jgi:hypothetical protein